MAHVNVDQSRAICPPKAYRPKTEGDFKQWVRHSEHYFTLLNIDNARKITMLLYNLREKASGTAFHIGLTDANNYDVAIQALMQYFSTVETPEELRTKFHQRFQFPKKSLKHYAMELRVLSLKAYPTMDEDVLEEMAKTQFILGVKFFINRERLIVKRPEKFKDAIEFARLSEEPGKTASGNPPPFNRNVFVAMPFRNSDNSRTHNNFKSSGSKNFSRNNFYDQTNVNEIFKNYNACCSYGSGQPQAPPQQQTCCKCGQLGHLANVCRSMPANMVEYSGPNQKQKSVFMSTFNKGQVPQTRTPFLKFTNNFICENSNSPSTEVDTAGAVFATGEITF